MFALSKIVCACVETFLFIKLIQCVLIWFDFFFLISFFPFHLLLICYLTVQCLYMMELFVVLHLDLFFCITIMQNMGKISSNFY